MPFLKYPCLILCVGFIVQLRSGETFVTCVVCFLCLEERLLFNSLFYFSWFFVVLD